MVGPAGDRGEPLARRRRCPAVVVVPPAEGRPVLAERADVEGTKADRLEPHALRQCWQIVETRNTGDIAPTAEGPVASQAASVGVPATDGYELLVSWRERRSVDILTPADRGAVCSKAAGVRPASADGRESLTRRRPFPGKVSPIPRALRLGLRIPPANRGAIWTEGTGVARAGTDGNEGLVSSRLIGRARRLGGVVALVPAAGGAVLAQCAGKERAGR